MDYGNDKNELKRVQFKISGVEKKVASNGSIFYNVKDENNKNFKIWQNKKDGSESSAYKKLKLMKDDGLGCFVTAAVEFQAGEFQGKPVTYKTIKDFITESSEPIVDYTEKPNINNDLALVMAKLDKIIGLLENKDKSMADDGFFDGIMMESQIDRE